MPRILLRSYSVSTDPNHATLKALLDAGQASSQPHNALVQVVAAPSVRPELFAQLTPPPAQPPLPMPDAMNSAGLNLTGLGVTAQPYVLRYGYAQYTGSAQNDTLEREEVHQQLPLGPESPLVQAAFAHLHERDRNIRDFEAFSDHLALPQTGTLNYAVVRNGQAVLSTLPAYPVTGATVVPGFTAGTGGTNVLTHPDLQVAQGVTPFVAGDTLDVVLQGTHPWPMPKGLLLSTSLGTADQAKALLNIPTSRTDLLYVWLYLNLPVLERYGHTDQPDVPQGEYRVTVPVGQWVRRVQDFNVRGAGLSGVEYRIAPWTDWVSVNTPSDLPVREETTGQLYTHSMELRVPLNQYSQVFTGLTFNVEEEDRFSSYEPPKVPEPTAQPVLSWRAAGKPLRALVRGKVVVRHPDMPAGMGGLVAYNAAGVQVYPRRRGDLLCFETAGPHTVYWNPVPDGPPLPTIGESTYQAVYAGVPRGVWDVAEQFREARNIIVPRFGVRVGGADFSAHMLDFQPGSVTLAGPASLFEMLPTAVQEVQVVGTEPIFTGKLIRAETQPYANGRVVSFQLVSNSEFFDVDMTRLNLEDEPVPEFEDVYVQRLLELSGFGGQLLIAPGLQWRDVRFWQAPLPAGPGMELPEVESRYKNTQNGSTLQTIKTVLQANMLDLYDLPSGDLYVDQILPQVDQTLDQLLKNARFVYCAASGTYVNDPRITVSSVSLALDDGFAEVEVEGFSNEVNLGIGKDIASFVQNGIQNNFLEKSLGGYQSSSNWAPEHPWPFERLENGALKGEFIPVEWFEQAQVSLSPASIEEKRTYQSGGFLGGGDKHIDWKEFRILSGTEAAAKWPARRADIQEFVDLFLPALDDPDHPKYDTPEKRMSNSRLVVGFAAEASGDYVSKATWQFKVNVAKPAEAQLRVVPLEGKFDARWAPEWMPPSYIHPAIQAMRNIKPRSAKKVSNPLIARLGSQYAVQVPTYPDGRITRSLFDNDWTTSASQLATWLTVKEFLKTRQVEVSLAGAQAVLPNQFLFIARRPPGGPGHPVTHVDGLLVLEPGRPDARVGNEAWTRVRCAYIGCVAAGEVTFDMPLGWGTTWEEV